jgi:hypothetical protein
VEASNRPDGEGEEEVEKGGGEVIMGKTMMVVVRVTIRDIDPIVERSSKGHHWARLHQCETLAQV